MTCSICGAAPVVATLHRWSGDHLLCADHLDLARTFNYRFDFDVDADLSILDPVAAAA